MNSEADNITALYERHAKDWDTDRGTNLLEMSWLDRFLKRLPRAGSILDIGCGSGRPISRYLIEQGFEVTGVDSSPTLIDICRGRFPIQRWIVADMRDLCLNTRFDGIIAWDSFFIFAHKISVECSPFSMTTPCRMRLCYSPAERLKEKP